MFLRFVFVGISGAVVDIAVLYLLSDSRTLHWNLNISKIISADVAICNNYVLNNVWTFVNVSPQRTLDHWLVRFCKYHLICLAGLCINILLLNIQVYWFHWNVYISNMIAICIVSVWNYIGNIKYTWNCLSLKK